MYWLVKGKGVVELYLNSPNGTGADSWSWINRDTMDEAVTFCSTRAIDCVLGQPGILSAVPCQDLIKCHKEPPYKIKDEFNTRSNFNEIYH
jgi:hypothetical protein